MTFRQPKDVDWYSLYNWVDVPFAEKENNAKVGNSKAKVVEKSMSSPTPLEEDKNCMNLQVSERIEDVPEEPQEEYRSEQKEVVEEESIEQNNRQQEIQGVFKIKPDPVLKLKKLLGITSKACPIIEFNKNPKYSDELTFACGNTVVHMNSESSIQRFTMPSSIQAPVISKLKMSQSFFLTMNDKNATIVWSNKHKNEPLMTFTPPLMKIGAMEIDKHEKLLVMGGKDQYKRDLLVVYNLEEILSGRVEIVARQLSDFDIEDIQWSGEQNSFISCGYENIRFWKIKSGTIAGKMAIFQQPLTGKKFIGVGYVNEYTHAIAATSCGTIFKIKVSNRTVEQVIKANESFDFFKIFNNSSNNPLWITIANDTFRLWDSNKKQQLLEHSMESQILHSSLNITNDKIAVLDSLGNIGILKLKQKTYESLIRSHNDSIIDFAFSEPTNTFVTGSKDGTIRVWSLTEYLQIAEFVVAQDELTGVACSPREALCVCSFVSGFIRVFDLDRSEHYECPGTSTQLSDYLRGVCYSHDGLTLAAIDGGGKIMLIDAKERRYEVFKTIQIESVNHNYLDMEFSPDNDLFGHIGSNANTVCLWETMNYTLKYQLDLTGDVISKIHFSPNGKDILILTATSKLKYFRLDSSNKACHQIMEVPGLHDLECTNFCISNNCGFIITSGKDYSIKVFDYGMRGDLFPAFQSFIGHQYFPSKILLSGDNTQLITVSKESNLIYVWDSFVNSPVVDIPNDIIKRETVSEVLVPSNEAPKPLSMPKLWNASNLPSKRWNLPPIIESPQEIQYEVPEAPMEEFSLSNKNLKLEYVIGYNGAGCENIIWESGKWIIYTSTNKLLIEVLENASPDSKKQLSVSFGADRVDSLSISLNKKFIGAYTKQSMYTGSTSVYILETESWKSISHITIPHPTIHSVSFSPNNNILMVLSGTDSDSVLHFYDYKAPELLFHSALPGASITAQWNTCSETGLEFVVMDSKKFDFWLLTPELSLQYQEGKQFDEKLDLTGLGFSVPVLGLMSTILMVAKSNGIVNLIDVRTNSPISSLKLASTSIKLLQWRTKRLIFATYNENVVYSIAINTQE